MKIIHIITGLGDGGAESNLYKLCRYDKTNQHIVISLSKAGKYGPLLEKNNIKVFCLNFTLTNFFFSFTKLILIIKKNKPNLIQTWMYHADLLGGVVGKILSIKKIFWNIRNTDLQINESKITTILIRKLLAFLSNYIPSHIISCSYKATSVHVKMGYQKKKIVQIPNGYDLSNFRYSKNKFLDLRNKLNINKKTVLLAMVARYDYSKDHLNLLKALQILNGKNLNFIMILAGGLMNKNNKILLDQIKRFNLKDKIKLIGSTNKIPQLMSEIDIHVLSSCAEAFPNVVAEAMAGKTPCIATDVGDSALIIRNTGWVVPSQNPKLLSKAINSAINEYQYKIKWNIRVNKCKNLIKNNYDIFGMVKKYQEIWQR